MNLKFAVSVAALLPMLAACGGSSSSSSDDGSGTGVNVVSPDDTGTGGGTGTGNGDTPFETDTIRPAAGTVTSSSIRGATVFSVPEHGSAGQGPATNNAGATSNFPRLSFGDFLWVNNAFNFSNTTYADWSQQIELAGADGNLVPTVRYDWGAEADLTNIFATSSFPELVYGVKSAAEQSASFDDIGLPIETALLPEEINISYDFSFEQQSTASPTGDVDPDGQPNADFSGFNVVAESFWHDSCDIERNGTVDDNQVFELMVWFHIGKRGPSAEGRNGSVGTFTTSDGVVYDAFTKTDAFFRGESNVRNFLAFVARDTTFSGTIPYHEFVNEALTNLDAYGTGWRNIQDSDCFANILLGSEVWYGAATMQWNDVTIEQVY